MSTPDRQAAHRTQRRCSLKLSPYMTYIWRLQSCAIANKLRPTGYFNQKGFQQGRHVEGLVTCAVMSMAGHTLTGFHFRTGEQRGSLATQRSSRSTAASTLPRCSSRSPQACRQQRALPPGRTPRVYHTCHFAAHYTQHTLQHRTPSVVPVIMSLWPPS